MIEDRRRILVVEDEPALREALRAGLEFEGYQVDVARDGLEALEQHERLSPDLVVLDILMPRMDGLIACRRLRLVDETTPVLMLTARDTVGDRVAGLDVGADDYLVKPFDLDELLARIRALLRRGALTSGAGGADPSAETNLLEYADLAMDTSTREVSRATTRLDLTPTEYQLLELFLRHPRQVLTRAQITRNIWGYDFEPTSNALDVYVMYLRRKTEIDDLPRLLHTVRGIGFVLRCDAP